MSFVYSFPCHSTNIDGAPSGRQHCARETEVTGQLDAALPHCLVNALRDGHKGGRARRPPWGSLSQEDGRGNRVSARDGEKWPESWQGRQESGIKLILNTCGQGEHSTASAHSLPSCSSHSQRARRG